MIRVITLFALACACPGGQCATPHKANGLWPTTIVVKVEPASAVVEFDGERTASTGAAREFETPPLDPLRKYTYTIAAYRDGSGNGVPFAKQTIEVSGGQVLVVDLKDTPQKKALPMPSPHKSCSCSAAGCKCGDDCKCPTEGACSPGCSCLLVGDDEKWRRDGVDKGKLREPKETQIRINGVPVSVRAARKMLEAKGNLADDSTRLRLTVIGSAEECKRVIADLKTDPSLTPYRDRLLIQEYRPENAFVKNYGFVTSGKPTIYLQAPTGEVLHRQDTYRGATALAEAIRKAQPDYDPKKDPDQNKPTLSASGLVDLLRKIPVTAWVLMAAGVAYYLAQQNKEEKK